MTSKRTFTRREFMQATALAAASAALAACATPTTAPTATQPPAPAATKAPEPTKPPEPTATEKPKAPDAPKATDVPKPTATMPPKPTEPPAPVYVESPMLAAMVAAGTLPPIEQRLPENPAVFTPLEMTGKHGGVIRRGFKGVSDKWGPTKLGDRGWIWFNKDLVNVPRFAESWEVNEDGTVWTFHLRKGAKWSDGSAFTTQDVFWWWQNDVTNKTINPTAGANYRTGTPGVVMQVETPDDFTAVFKFAHPNPLFILKIGRDMLCAPSQYMKQWHIDFTTDKDALQKKITDAGFESWNTYYRDDRSWWHLNPELPTLRPFNAKNSMAEELFLMERNPYFWGVDSEGNQLPYLDGINHRLFETVDVFNLRIVNGEIDFQARHVDAGNYTLFKENEAVGDYKVAVGVSASHLALQLNLATKNDKLREFFNTRNVRIGLSYAIDREMINELIYNGLATPRQYSPLPMSPQYYEKLSNSYLEYDPEKCGQMLDEAGYVKGADGYRTYPDGETISFTVEGTDQAGSPLEDAVQQVVKMIDAVGVKCAYKYAERALYTEHYEANEIEGAWWGGDRTVLPLAPSAIIFRGVQPDRPWAAGYAMWYNDPTRAGSIEPPADHFIMKLWKLWDEISVQADPAKQNELFRQMLDIWVEELPMIGVLGELPSLAIVKNGFKNFPEGFPNDDTTGDENVYNTETYTWEEPEKHVG